MRRIISMLVAVTAAGGLALFGLISAGAASAGTAGTTGPGSWSFDPGDGSNTISTTYNTSTSTSTAYQAQIQQPINPNGSSVWPTKKGVIPVQFYLQQATDTKTTKTPTTVYPDTLTSDGTPYPGLNSYSALFWTPPSGSGLTVGGLTNLTAYFRWLEGQNQAGSMRWTINTPDGNVYVYYGEPFNTGAGTVDSGVNMITDPTNTSRVEAQSPLPASPQYDTWNNVMPRPVAGVGSIASEPVNWVQLVIDSGTSTAPEQVQLSDVQITAGGNTSEYVPGTVTGTPVTTDSFGPWANTTSPAMYIDIAKGTSADPGTVDETTYTGVGDTSGQFAVVDGKYKYNLSNNLSTGTYNVFMTPNTDANRIPVTNSPTGAATFVLK
jgi:hypothetical protein